MIDIQETAERLREHLKVMTIEIGERSVSTPENLQRTADYIHSFYRKVGLATKRELFDFHRLEAVNILAEVSSSENPSRRYLLGAHYDSVTGTVGADDNASAIAVQLEVARHFQALIAKNDLNLAVQFASFALEEPPVYGTGLMGSRVRARRAKKEKEKIDGMLCLEMVGYSCSEPGCQEYPLPLMFKNYPRNGTFIGIVGNLRSRQLTHSLHCAFSENQNLPVVKLTVPMSGWLLPSVRLSDHASFWDAGFKAVMITDTAFFRNPHYHLPTDTMEKLDYRFMAQLVNSLLIWFSKIGKI